MVAKGYSKSSIDSYQKSVDKLLSWLEDEAIDIDQLVYADLLNYLNHLQKQHISQRTINSYLIGVQHYLEFKQIEVDHIKNLRVKNTGTRIMIAHVLPYEMLEELYDQYPTETNYQKRYKVMLGLMIYQGMNSRDIGLMKSRYVNLNEAAIHVPSSKSSNERTLKLDSKQILLMDEYLKEVRCWFTGDDVDKLLLTTSKNLQNSFHRLMVNVSRINSKIVSVQQLRASVIHHWLKHHNLREVQYRCGHKYFSSTEKYFDPNMEMLEDELGSYHPLGK